MNPTISNMKRRTNIANCKTSCRFISVYYTICTYMRRIQSIYCVQHYIDEIGNKYLNLFLIFYKDYNRYSPGTFTVITFAISLCRQLNSTVKLKGIS